MNVFEAAARAIRNGSAAALATVIGGKAAPRTTDARMLIFADGETVGTIGGGVVEHRVRELALQVIATGRPRRYHAASEAEPGMGCGGDMEVYVEPLQVRTPMTIFGAGHVAHATARLLQTLNFFVTIVDDRSALAAPERFPGCAVHVASPLAFVETVETTPASHFLLMTHLHMRDRDLLRSLVTKPHAWIGMLGSRRKISQIFHRLAEDGIAEAQMDRLHTPVGLDIGAETPDEIAVSIAASLIATRRGAAVPVRTLKDVKMGR
ncbi:MAG: XdhC/CoxI family protein [Myxococcota bacterium]